ncbi:hypothetical protein [Streptomyces lancefieldiae]|uniref:Uncharacterized protein n=1 Tax=Streptomyces lancefieldiae TaxID=3075520 RepID=A0ABU3B421_9ACTN|nr:hypothetical protein [Streptomyces sp. DSM 40712]MDT0616577.1 hypothetical protein [Streptomyces sp. DSM 40712]
MIELRRILVQRQDCRGRRRRPGPAVCQQRTTPFDAAVVAGVEPAADWPPAKAQDTGRAPVLWLAGPAS